MTDTIFVNNNTVIDESWMNDVNRSTYHYSNKADAIANTPVNGTVRFVGGTDGGWFKEVTGASPGTYSDNGGSYCGTVFIPTGGDGSEAWVRDSDGYYFDAAWFGLVGDNSTDETTLLNSTISAVDTSGGGLLVLNPSGVYIFSGTLQMKRGVTVGYFVKNNILAATTYSQSELGVPTLKCAAMAVNAIEFDSDQTLAGLQSIKIDLTAQTAGHGIVFDDTAGSLRPGQFLNNVHIFEAADRAIQIDAGNKEGRLYQVYCRCGNNDADRVSNYGLYYEAVDWAFEHVFLAYAAINGLYVTGGAGRFMYVDAWGCGDYGVVLATTTANWYYRLQSNSNEKGGLKLDGAHNQRFLEYTTIDNSQDGTTDHDILVTGACRDLEFTHNHFRGSTAAPATYYVFSDETGVNVNVSGGIFSSTYTDIGDETVRAYFSLNEIGRSTYPSRESLIKPTNHNTNPYFVEYTTGIPNDWAARNSGTAAQITTGLPTPEYTSGVRVTSGAATTTGIQLVLDHNRYKGQRVRITGLFLGDAAAPANQQFIQVYDGVSSTVEYVTDSSNWSYVAQELVIDSAAAVIQVRIVAGNNSTAGYDLDCTGVSVETY